MCVRQLGENNFNLFIYKKYDYIFYNPVNNNLKVGRNNMKVSKFNLL